MGQHDLAGNELDSNGNVYLSQKHPIPNYRGLTAVKLPRGALIITILDRDFFFQGLNAWSIAQIFTASLFIDDLCMERR